MFYHWRQARRGKKKGVKVTRNVVLSKRGYEEGIDPLPPSFFFLTFPKLSAFPDRGTQGLGKKGSESPLCCFLEMTSHYHFPQSITETRKMMELENMRDLQFDELMWGHQRGRNRVRDSRVIARTLSWGLRWFEDGAPNASLTGHRSRCGHATPSPPSPLPPPSPHPTFGPGPGSLFKKKCFQFFATFL